MSLAFIKGPVPECVVREVGATPEAFERDLRKAWAPGVARLAEGLFRLSEGELVLEISIATVGVRKIGLLSLPISRAEYRFFGGDEPERRKLLGVLDRAMQRGGG